MRRACSCIRGRSARKMHFCPSDLKQGTDPTVHGNLEAEILPYLRAGIDGFFTDNADLGFKAREAFIQ